MLVDAERTARVAGAGFGEVAVDAGTPPSCASSAAMLLTLLTHGGEASVEDARHWSPICEQSTLTAAGAAGPQVAGVSGIAGW